MQTQAPPARPRLGLALGSGAARGWAHLGVLHALDTLGVEVDVFAGCSAGALVGGARLLGIEKAFASWAKSIGPLAAMRTFGFAVRRGGLINPDRAFAGFEPDDRPIEALPKPFGAVATDLATGQEVWLTRGSTLAACRASSAVPMLVQAARYMVEDREYWLVDGATSNPVPVNLARALGAEVVIAVDLNAITQALSRFDRPTTRAVVAVAPPSTEGVAPMLRPMASFLAETHRDVARRLALSRARALAQPQLLETALATVDILQGQLAQARALVDVAELRLTPDLGIGSAAAFDQWEEFVRRGYAHTMEHADEILALASGHGRAR